MDAGEERRLLARARELADLSELHDDTLACLGAARHAGLDPDALAGLVGCAIALGAASIAIYTAGDGWTGTHPDERAFLADVAGIEDDLDESMHAGTMLARQAAAALDAARAGAGRAAADARHARGDLHPAGRRGHRPVPHARLPPVPPLAPRGHRRSTRTRLKPPLAPHPKPAPRRPRRSRHGRVPAPARGPPTARGRRRWRRSVTAACRGACNRCL